MKTISKRSVCALIVSVLFCVGLMFFIFEYYLNGPEWVTQPYNHHIFKNGVLTGAGKIIDSADQVLAETSEGKRLYNDSASMRRATVHVVGDKPGNIATSVQRVYRSELIGFNFLTGVGRHGGYDLKLTISGKACSTALASLDDYNGTVGVYNYKTGEIILLASAPTFDPVNPPKITEKNKDDYEGIYINRFLSSVFTPGSVFKVITTAAALERIPGIEDETFKCSGSIEFDGDKITCPQKHGTLTLGEALTVSCNTTYAKISHQLGKETLTQYAELAGFNTRFYADEIRLGMSKFDVSGADGGALAWAGIGQYTDLANPCHFMMIMGAVANGGIPTEPFLVEGMTLDQGFSVQDSSIKSGERMFSAETAAKLTELMRDNVKNNYGDKQFGGLSVCAKTGTAQVGENKRPNAWFAGFAMDEKYPLAFVVMLENAGSGSGIAAPVAASALKAAVKAIDGK